LGVGVEAVHEVVHDELQFLLARRGDVDLVALLQQTLVGVHDFEVFARIAGKDQDLCHREPLASSVSGCPYDPWRPLPSVQRVRSTRWTGRMDEAKSGHQCTHQLAVSGVPSLTNTPGVCMTVPLARSGDLER